MKAWVAVMVMLTDAWLIARKDLKLEIRSRVAINQVMPFALLVLVLFAFALDPDRGLLEKATPGLYWIAVLFSGLLAMQRAFSLEAADDVTDALRLSGLSPAGIYLGKTLSVAVQLLVLEVLLGIGVAVLYGTSITGWLLLLATIVVATAAISTAGTLFGVVAAGLRVRETLLPLLLLPVLAPVLIGATRAFEAALSGTPSEGWPWVGLMSVFAVVYAVAGIFGFGPLMEES
jgi:heme exporter protein B